MFGGCCLQFPREILFIGTLYIIHVAMLLYVCILLVVFYMLIAFCLYFVLALSINYSNNLENENSK